MYNMSMKFIQQNWYRLVLLSDAFFLPVSRLFADSKDCPPGKICNPLPNITSVDGFVYTLLTGVLKIGIPIVALSIIYCGFLFVSARGNTEKLTQAKSALLYTLIGAAILLGSWAIAELISNTVVQLG